MGQQNGRVRSKAAQLAQLPAAAFVEKGDVFEPKLHRLFCVRSCAFSRVVFTYT